jgi:two-component system OmpR family response regulator
MRVLVVDDEEHLSRAMKAALEAEGMYVDVASDGKSGLKAALDGGYDAIVLDLLLPLMTGYKVCQELRRSGITTPILMLSAKSGDYDQAEGIEMGADDYLTKPVSMVVLAAHLKALVRRAKPVAPAELVSGSLRFDPVQRRCTRREEEVYLTSREAAVLDVLLRAEGRAVSKDELKKTVWHRDVDDNVVEVYVGYLRRKIDHPFGLSSVATLRGQGYRLVPQE